MAIKTFTDLTTLPASDINTYLANSGTVFVTSGTLTTNVTRVEGCFSSTYLNYLVLINGASLSTGFDIFWRLRAGGTTNVDPQYNQQGYTVQSGAVSGIGDAGAQQFRAAICDTNPLGKSIVNIYNPNTTARTGYDYNATGFIPGGYITRAGGGIHNVLSSFDSIEFTTSGGNMAGTFSIYGYRTA
jgi:hypothetical protein